MDIREHTDRQADQPSRSRLIYLFFKADYNLDFRAGLSVCVLANADIIDEIEGQQDFRTLLYCTKVCLKAGWS